MAIALPSRNVIYVFCACAILVSGVALAAHILAPAPASPAAASADDPSRAAAFSLVKQAFDAETSAAADALADSGTSTPSAASSAKLSATEQFSHLIVDKYFAAKKQKGTLTDQDIQGIAVSAMKTPIPTAGARKYSRADLSAVSATPAQLHAYGNSLVKIFEANIPADTGQELYVVNDILESNNPAKGARLAAISASYRKMIAQTLALKAPDIAALSVIDYVNSLSSLALAVDNMGKVLSDPILAVKGINQREGFATAAVRNLEAVGAILRQHGVSYAASEKGAELFPAR